MARNLSPYVLSVPARRALRAFAYVAVLAQTAILVLHGYILKEASQGFVISGVWAVYERWDWRPQPFAQPSGALSSQVFTSLFVGLAGSAGLLCLAGFRLRRPRVLALLFWIALSLITMLLILATERIWIPPIDAECWTRSSCFHLTFPGTGLVENLLGIWLPLLAYAILPFVLLRRRRRMAADMASAAAQAPQATGSAQPGPHADSDSVRPAGGKGDT
jgi:hypothetical protein